jgi:hypothetical protein
MVTANEYPPSPDGIELDVFRGQTGQRLIGTSCKRINEHSCSWTIPESYILTLTTEDEQEKHTKFLPGEYKIEISIITRQGYVYLDESDDYFSIVKPRE